MGAQPSKSPSAEASDPQQPDVPRGARYWLGVALLILGLILPVLALILVPLFGFPQNVNAVVYGLSIAGGPDVLLVLAAAAMGKENIDRILGKVAPWLKRFVRWDDVSRSRYLTGLWVLVVAVVVPVVIGLFFEDAVVDANNKPDWGYYVMVASDFGFIAGFFIMGAPLWDRIRAVFTWNATISFPPPEEADA